MGEWQSLTELFFSQADGKGDKPFLWATEDDVYQSISWAGARDQASALAKGLRSLGIEKGDRVVLCAENRPEWVIANVAVMAAGAITVPAYTTNTVKDHLHILANSGAKGAIVSTKALAGNLLQAAHQTDTAKFVITIEDVGVEQSPGPSVLTWDDALKKGEADDFDVRGEVASHGKDDTAVIIYTSGTGGTPKGVMLHHAALLHNIHGARDALLEIGLADEVFLSFLPLSHVYEYMAGQFFPILIGAEIYFAEGIEHLSKNMGESHPTIMTAVPRLYEVMHSKITKGVEKAGGLKQKLFNAAVDLGSRNYENPGSLTIGQSITNVVVDKLVRSKVKKNFGGRLKVLVSGGAPLNYEIGLFFTALGLRLLQGYGQTESAPLISVNRPRKIKLKTVGPAVLNTEIKIAEDGEILVKGDLVMQGYWQNPEATAEAIQDGWLHTGDIGRLDEDGYLEITDRKKDIIVNSGGDTLSPQRVEGFLTLQPEIAQAMVHGDKRPHLVGLIVPDAEFAAEWAAENAKPKELNLLIEDAEFVKAIDAAIERVNAELAVNERVRRFTLIADQFTTDNEMMTPSLKIRRHKIIDVYGAQVTALY